MKCRREHLPGFTLLELILVMMVVCVALALAAPSLRQFWTSRRGDDAAAQVLALTQWARSQAVTNGRLYRLNVDSQVNAYWLTMQDGDQFVSLDQEFGRVFSMPQDTSIGLARTDRATVDYIDFYPSGRMDPATIQIIDPHGQEIQIICESPTEPFHLVTPRQERS